MRKEKPHHNVDLAKRRLARILEDAGADRVDDVELKVGDTRYKLDDYLVAHAKDPKAAYEALPRKLIAGWSPPPVTHYGGSFDPTKVPSRPWVIHGRYALGEVTAFVGPPGVNKSMQILTDAVSIVTGKPILERKPEIPGEALLLVGEDGRLDFDARLAAILQRYKLTPKDLGDRLHVVTLPEIEDPGKYSLAKMADDVAVLNLRMFRWLREYPRVIFIAIDPAIAWHQLLENSNEALQAFLNALKGLAAQSRRVVVFDHHVNKASMMDVEAHVGNLAAIRGGTVIAAAIRWAFTLAKINKETAKRYAIDENERWLFRRLDPLKANYGPDRSEDPTLLKIEVVHIPNKNRDAVAVITEIPDAAALREAGAQRAEEDDRLRREEIGRVLAKMLDAIGIEGHCNMKDAITWLSIHAPNLVRGKHGKPLSTDRVRQDLPKQIGAAGIDVPKRGRIVIENKGGKGNGARYVISLKSERESER